MRPPKARPLPLHRKLALKLLLAMRLPLALLKLAPIPRLLLVVRLLTPRWLLPPLLRQKVTTLLPRTLQLRLVRMTLLPLAATTPWLPMTAKWTK